MALFNIAISMKFWGADFLLVFSIILCNFASLTENEKTQL